MLLNSVVLQSSLFVELATQEFYMIGYENSQVERDNIRSIYWRHMRWTRQFTSIRVFTKDAQDQICTIPKR